MVLRFRYSMWDGTQDVPPLEAEDILDNLTDDLMNFGDLQHALRNLLQRGMRDPNGQRMQGLRDLLQQLRQQRRQQLDKFNLNSVFDDIKRQLEEIVQMERDTLDRRLDEVDGNQPPSDQQSGQPQAGQQQPGQQGQQQSGEQGQQQSGQQGQQSQGQQQGQRSQAGQQQSGQRGQQQPGQPGQQQRASSPVSSPTCCATSPIRRRTSWTSSHPMSRGR